MKSLLLLWSVMLLSLGGCLNITTSLQPENANVAEIRRASDCVPIFLGLANGHATLEGALADPGRLVDSRNFKDPRQRLTQIRRVQLHDFSFLGFGARCVEVVGE